MLTSATKRFILPFSTPKISEPEVEAAAVFAITEFERSKGGGLITKQPRERLAFIAKVGYPLWLFPRNDTVFVFDGLNESSYSVSYAEVRSAKAFMEILSKSLAPRENLMAFLSDHDKYFQESAKQRQFTLRGLIASLGFKEEFKVYRKEALEATDQALANLALLLPILEEPTISSMLTDLDKLQSVLKEDASRLPECIRLINKTTSQYMTEIDYESQAVKEEADAKIKAQEELITPQIAKLNSDYKRKIKDVTESFDQELESLQKLKTKTEKLIETNETKIRQFEREAKSQAQKNHRIYERRWKDKSKQTGKEVSGLKKELKNIEKNIKNVNKRKIQEISKLNFELDGEIKLAREPLVQLEASRNAKMQVFRQETEKLLRQEKPVIEGLNRSIKLREEINANFEALGMGGQQLKSPALFYVSFYVACYEVGLARRYLVLPPSTVSKIDFSAKLKGALRMSKTRDRLTPRFSSIATLIGKVQVLTKQNSVFESQLGMLGERSNLLKNSLFLENVKKGLVYLKHEGWLSDKEYEVLSGQLAA
jgi:hypothetical protein